MFNRGVNTTNKKFTFRCSLIQKLIDEYLGFSSEEIHMAGYAFYLLLMADCPKTKTYEYPTIIGKASAYLFCPVDDCFFGAKKLLRLKLHVESVHDGDEKKQALAKLNKLRYKCKCGKEYSTYIALVDHTATHHARK